MLFLETYTFIAQIVCVSGMRTNRNEFTTVFRKYSDVCLSDISGWMTNNKLRLSANKTDFIIIGTFRQPIKLTHFFPTNILSHSSTPSDTVRNLGATFDSDFNFRKHVSLT